MRMSHYPHIGGISSLIKTLAATRRTRAKKHLPLFKSTLKTFKTLKTPVSAVLAVHRKEAEMCGTGAF